ncbi:hypothetical protein ACOMHN_066232 [Nucella lapillus]
MVMSRRSMRSPTTTFLLALSVLQLCYITLSLLPALYRIFNPLDVTDAFYIINGIYVANYFMTSLRRCMYCLQCFVSTERLLAVWFPLKAKQFLLVRRPWLFIFLTPVVVFLVNIHVPLKLEMWKKTTDVKNETIYTFRYSDHYRRHPEVFKELNIVTKSVFVYLTLCVMMATNLAMICVLIRSRNVRRQMNTTVDTQAAHKRESQMTMTILVSTLIFVVLCLPTVTNSLAYNAVPESYGPFSPRYRHIFLFVQKLGTVCFILAFSTDVFTYVGLSSAYRNTLLRMLKIKTRPEDSYSTRTESATEEITSSSLSFER